MATRTWLTRALGRTTLQVPALCIGTSELSGWKNFYQNPPDEEEALATVRAILDGPIGFLDTAAGYGESERRIGVVVKERQGLPPGFVLATKVDPDPQTRDYSGRQARRCVEQSLRLLGLERLPLVYIHDPENTTFEQAMAPDGPVAALQQCRDEGMIEYIGVAGGPIDLMMQFVETGAFQVVLSHNRYTLLNRAAQRLWEQAPRYGVAAINAAPFGGGILSKGPSVSTSYAYKPASADVLSRAWRIEELCTRYEVPLGAAALQFSLRDTRIASTVVGISRAARLREMVELAEYMIPEEFWSELGAVTPDIADLA